MKIMRRPILNEVLSQKPTQPLYHYTTQKGLLGIIGSREMWVTHTQYLNDRREFVHAIDLAREHVRQLLKTSSQNDAHMVRLDRMQTALDLPLQSINVCVCSFSEDRDSLSQWRAYGSKTSGFAIGLPADLLIAATERKGWYLARCVYDPSRQREIIVNLVEEVLEEALLGEPGFTATEKDEQGIPFRGAAGNLLAYLYRYAPILKDGSFQEEREWRVISRPLMNQGTDFSFREGRSLLIPYSKFPLHAEDLGFRVQEVVIGPTPEQELSKRSVTNFIQSRGMDVATGLEEIFGEKGGVGVEVSRVPYRDW
jgi:hypothetical protein